MSDKLIPGSAVAAFCVTVIDAGDDIVGASFTPVTFTVIVLGLWSRSTPTFVVPPSSLTWNVKVV